MDIKSFSAESFDPVIWINKSFDEMSPEASREGHASGLAYKLQLFIQEINNSLEQTAHQVIRSLPLVLKQAESLEDDVKTLTPLIKRMQSLAQGSCDSLEDCEGLERAHALHEVIQRMKSCLEIVKQQELIDETLANDDQLQRMESSEDAEEEEKLQDKGLEVSDTIVRESDL